MSSDAPDWKNPIFVIIVDGESAMDCLAAGPTVMREHFLPLAGIKTKDIKYCSFREKLGDPLDFRWLEHLDNYNREGDS